MRTSRIWWALILVYWATLWIRFASNLEPPSLRTLMASEIVAWALFIFIATMTYRLVRDINGLQALKRSQRT